MVLRKSRKQLFELINSVSEGVSLRMSLILPFLFIEEVVELSLLSLLLLFLFSTDGGGVLAKTGRNLVWLYTWPVSALGFS